MVDYTRTLHITVGIGALPAGSGQAMYMRSDPTQSVRLFLNNWNSFTTTTYQYSDWTQFSIANGYTCFTLRWAKPSFT